VLFPWSSPLSLSLLGASAVVVVAVAVVVPRTIDVVASRVTSKTAALFLFAFLRGPMPRRERPPARFLEGLFEGKSKRAHGVVWFWLGLA
jgi:hypothetical protein